MVRILDAESGGRNLRELWFDEYGCSLSFARQAGIAGISDKGDFGDTCLFNSFDACHFQL